MRGYIDLHCHYVPAVDDGVRTVEDSVSLCRGLAAVGYDLVVATPHIRTAMFENRKPGLERAFATLREQTADVPDMPQLGLAAEHWCDDVFWGLFRGGESMPYPGGKAALVEFPTQSFPQGVEKRFFEMNVRGVRPVLAHPERYTPLFNRTEPIDKLLDIGVVPLLDLMSLTGKYGAAPKRAAERMLEDGVYYAACSDSHKPSDVEIVGDAIARLQKLVGDEEAYELLAENPRRILDGTVEL